MTYQPMDLAAIRERVEKAQVGPWRVHEDGKEGDDWPLAHFGECAHHNKTKIWVTTDRLNASRSNGACPCEDAYFTANAKTDILALLSEVEDLRKTVIEMAEALELSCFCDDKPTSQYGKCAACDALSLPVVQVLTKEAKTQP